ncbi:neurogenic locus notch homolog protein 1 [Plakobranchus ocellatus]|uniref:Neurogenic locus notch homolog protein 1 n=1 Tax=Plakobranchus ocellatus TaxID=259542 RepID=A0AAV4BCW1_9GAST|nr:neurogenic locus notch homolog protein 1 [Plakobranchus ocellatus]
MVLRLTHLLLPLLLLLCVPLVRCQDPQNLCSDNLCENGAMCEDLGYDYSCNCTAEYTGWYCNVTLDQPCTNTSLPCQNGATCVDTGTPSTPGFKCQCPPQFEGPLCERDICADPKCDNGGTCRFDASSPDKYVCDCDRDRDFQGPTCSDIIPNCEGVNCNNGVCKDGVRNHTCVCNQGWNGASCDQKVDLCVSAAPICQHGSCVDGACLCDEDWTASSSSSFSSYSFSSSSSSSSSYLFSSSSFSSSLSSSSFFSSSSSSSSFSSSPLDFVNNTNSTSWWCQCPQFVEGQLCKIVGPCYDQPCIQGQFSVCEQSVENNTYTCICTAGWQGKNCSEDIDECTTNDPTDRHRCVAGNGDCVNFDGGYSCACNPGFTGPYCETDIDECEPAPCLHGGRCTDAVNNFTCDCSGTGYEGFTCDSDVDECKKNVTVCNLGNCSNQVPGYTCQCGDRWRGLHCERENPCYNISCQHGGTCQENVTAVEERCACADGYEGVLCEKASASSSGSSTDLGVIIGPIVGAVVLVIIIIVVIAFVMTARSKRATRGEYSPSAQETSGSRVELGNVLKKPPEERLI